MKKMLLKIAVAVLLLCVTFPELAAAPSGSDLFSKVKISVSSQSAPRYNESSPTDSSTGNLRNKWLVIAVDYTPRLSGIKDKNAWIDDVVLVVRLQLVSSSRDRAVTYVFTGETEFWTIPLDGRKHTATMMVPPHLLDRYLPPSGVGSTVSTSSLPVEAVFYDRTGAVIGRGQTGFKSDAQAEEFFRNAESSRIPVLEGAILPRNKTPWQWSKVDDFDLIKPEVSVKKK